MRVTVVGSTGRTGRLVLTEGLRRDWPSPAPTPWSQKGPVWPSHCCDSCSPKGTPIWRRWSRPSPPPINGGTSPEPLAEPHNLETHAGHARPPSRRPGATVAMRHTRPIQRWAVEGRRAYECQRGLLVGEVAAGRPIDPLSTLLKAYP
jgi:hypothetical protein